MAVPGDLFYFLRRLSYTRCARLRRCVVTILRCLASARQTAGWIIGWLDRWRERRCIPVDGSGHAAPGGSGDGDDLSGGQPLPRFAENVVADGDSRNSLV